MTDAPHARRAAAVALGVLVVLVAGWQLTGAGPLTGPHPANPAGCEIRSVSPATPNCP